MAIRTLDSRVRELLPTKDDVSLVPFITTANNVVNRLLTLDDEGLIDSATAELIERWLAAHYYSQAQDQPYTARSTDGASGQFQGRTDMYLESTHYGQTAIQLDPTGELANLGKAVRVRMEWLGTISQSPEQ